MCSPALTRSRRDSPPPPLVCSLRRLDTWSDLARAHHVPVLVSVVSLVPLRMQVLEVPLVLRVRCFGRR
jgi:hypothetical protein